jgi:hypothetical protein
VKLAIGLFFLSVLSIGVTAQTKVLHPREPTTLKFKLGWNDSPSNDATCDPKGNIFVTVWNPAGEDPSDRPLLEFDNAGLLKAKFASSRKDLGLSRFEDHVEPLALLPEGELARVAWSRDSFYLAKYAADGKLQSRTKLDPPAIIPYQLAVFRSGEILVSGLEHNHSVRSISSYKSFTAIYDKNGRLLKRLSLPEDAEIEAAIEAGDSRYAMALRSGNRAVSGGNAKLGEDGNVYLMRRTSPVTIYVISSSGALVRTLHIETPNSGELPFDMQLSGDRIALQFLMGCAGEGGQCSGVNLRVADSMSGEKLASYDDEHFWGSLACFTASPERFTSLTTTDKDKLQTTSWTAK